MAEKEEKDKENPPPPPDRVEKTEAQKKWDDIISSALSDATEEDVDVLPTPTPSKRIDKTPPEEAEKIEKKEEPIEKYKIELNIPDISGETVVLKRGKEEEKPKEEKPKKKKRKKKKKEGKGMDEEYKEEISKITESIKDLQEEIDSLYSVTSNLSNDVSSISGKVSQMDSKVEELENVKDEYRKIEEMVRELSGLYDLITADINPFMEIESTPEEARPGKSRSGKKERELGLGQEKTTELNNAAMIEWAEFLSERVPPAKIEDILNYYQDIDWIDQRIKKKVLSYMEGVKRGKGAAKGAKDKVISEDGEVVSEDWRLTPKEHQKSLQYIKNIKGEYSEIDIDEYLEDF